MTDLILNRRLFCIFEKYQNFPSNNRFLGFLAFSTGTILTASKIYDHAKRDALELLELAQIKINDAKEIACIIKTSRLKCSC